MIHISAHVANHPDHNDVSVTTNALTQSLAIPPKAGGLGSSANGEELLFLALATCYCNDLYREAARRRITVHGVEVEVSGTFGDDPGSVAEGVTYRARITAEADEETIQDLAHHTDTVAEVQNTLRQGMAVTLEAVEAVPAQVRSAGK